MERLPPAADYTDYGALLLSCALLGGECMLIVGLLSQVSLIIPPFALSAAGALIRQ